MLLVLTALLFFQHTFCTDNALTLMACNNIAGFVCEPNTPCANAASAGTTVKLFSTTLVSSAASITVSGIPGTYSKLDAYLVSRGDTNAAVANIAMQLNGDTATNYNNRNNLSSGNFNANGTSNPIVCVIPALQAASNYSGTCSIQIQFYANTTFFKSVISLTDWFSGTQGNGIQSLSWGNTNAVTSFKIFPTAGNFVAGTSLVVYGVI